MVAVNLLHVRSVSAMCIIFYECSFSWREIPTPELLEPILVTTDYTYG